MSIKQAKLNIEYLKRRRIFLQNNPMCAVYPYEMATQVHHVRGRGKYFLHESTWLAVSDAGHKKIERDRAWARKMGFLVYGRNAK